MIDTKALKPGDEVLLADGWSYKDYRFAIVKDVSKSGRVTIENGTIFNPDGSRRGEDKH